MTIVAVWYEPEDKGAWVVADTRISRPGQQGTIVQTDAGTKIFTLPVQATALSLRVPVEKPARYHKTFGVAFAGDVLPATMTIAAASSIFLNLVATGQPSAPALCDIATSLEKIGRTISGEILTGHNQNYGRFEAIILGRCDVRRCFLAYSFRCDTDVNHTSTLTEHRLEEDLEPVVLGSGVGRFRERLGVVVRDGDPHGRTRRLPKLVVEQLVKDAVGDIGGGLGIGWANPDGFHPFNWTLPVSEGAPASQRIFNGLDLDSLGRVGPYSIGITGLA